MAPHRDRPVRPLVRVLASALLLLLAWPTAALAQPAPPAPVAQPPEFAAVRARFEILTPAQVQALGYVLPAPECVASPLGGMGYHAINFRLHEAQFHSGRMDPQNPPILLIGGDGRVIGLEWETNQHAPAPMLFGQRVEVQPGHPGLQEPHYMLHAYFRPGGQVLFAPFDPLVACPTPGTVPPGFAVAGAPAAPAQLPTALPRTGNIGSLGALLAGAGVATLLAGAILRRRRAR